MELEAARLSFYLLGLKKRQIRGSGSCQPNHDDTVVEMVTWICRRHTINTINTNLRFYAGIRRISL
jgi:hypothetical protein